MKKTVHRVFLFLLCLATVACGSSPTPRYYLLNAAAGPQASNAKSEQIIGIGPIDFPSYLDRSQLVVRRGVELELLEYQRWAEPLAENFMNVLAESIARQASTDQVLVYPWANAQRIDRRIRGKVTRFDVDESGQAVLMVRWQIHNGDGQVLVPARRSEFTRTATTGGGASMVTALSGLIDALGAKITTALDNTEGE